VSLSAAADEPFVALEKPLGLRLLTDDLWSESGIDPEIVFEASEIPTMEGLVAAGFGVAVVPVPREGADARVVHVPLSNTRAKREVGLAWGRDRPLAPPSERFLKFLLGT
jgi:DNA-binding transcriptional LysR family regulator